MIPATRFLTDKGKAVPAVTMEQMRELDRIAMEETGPNLFQMMENAGANLAALAIEELGEDGERASVLVLAGPGGNGGGGLCAARHLANHGFSVTVCLSDAHRMGPVPAEQLRIFRHTAGREIPQADLAVFHPQLVLDALIGYSLRGPPRGAAAELIRWANGCAAPIVALDLPSGLDATSGEAPGDAIRARTTMTLALPKTGLFVAQVGRLLLADIGIPEGAYRRLGVPYSTPFDHRTRVPLQSRTP